MHRLYHQWHSSALGRPMEFLVFGHAGPICLVFPTSQGRFYDYENFGMVEALTPQLQAGTLQLVCLDSIDSECWFNHAADTAARMHRHDQFEQYILSEVLPCVRTTNDHKQLITTGCSFGASHAMIFALRYPHMVNRVIALSGLYDVRQLFSHYTDAVYFHNPIDFLPNLMDKMLLYWIRKMDIIFAIGAEDELAWSNYRLSQIMWDKGIWHALRVWEGWAHEWSSWQQMMTRYINGSD